MVKMPWAKGKPFHGQIPTLYVLNHRFAPPNPILPHVWASWPEGIHMALCTSHPANQRFGPAWKARSHSRRPSTWFIKHGFSFMSWLTYCKGIPQVVKSMYGMSLSNCFPLVKSFRLMRPLIWRRCTKRFPGMTCGVMLTWSVSLDTWEVPSFWKFQMSGDPCCRKNCRLGLGCHIFTLPS